MDVREKLVELLKTNACPSPFMCDPTCKYYGFGDCFPDRFADYLIAHGVTVQKWISVDDRLPESGKEGVLIALRWGMVDIGWYEEGQWSSEFVNEYEDGEVTHWMPLPQPPKGEKSSD